MKKGDWIILLSALVLIGVGLLGAYLLRVSGGAPHVVIEVDRKVIYDIPLTGESKAKIIQVEEGNGQYNRIEIKQGVVRVVEANCPDKICVKWSAIRNNGETIVCLPHRMVIKILGGKQKGSIDSLSS